jgi:translation initiation factor 1
VSFEEPILNVMSRRERIPTERIPNDGGPGLSQNPFAALSSQGLPAGPETSPEINSTLPNPTDATKPKKNRGRVDIIRQTAGRGGKTVTVVKNFVGIGLPEKEKLAKAMQRACGTGGTVKDGQIEIQGDKREEVARILTEANFRPVFAGG